MEEEDHYDFECEHDEDDDAAYMDCGLFLDGGKWFCSKAGSEECDWECPFS